MDVRLAFLPGCRLVVDGAAGGDAVSDLEPSGRHPMSCPVWASDDLVDECDCGADDLAVDMPVWQPDPGMPLLAAEPGSLADHLNHIGEAS